MAIEDLVDRVMKSLEGYVSRRVESFEKRMEERLAAIKAEKGEKGDRGEPGPAGADGKDGKDGDAGPQGLKGEKGDAGEAGRDGMEGPAGRDALQIDVVDLDPEKKYRKNTYATFRGGLLRAYKATEPIADGDIDKAGWQVVVNGLDEAAIELAEDSRTVGFAMKMTTGQVVIKQASIPVVLDRGVWKDAAYEQGDGVTWDGCFWIAQRKTLEAEKPGDKSGAFRLAVKKGRDGRDGLRGEKGERGAEGRAGKDATQLGPNGGKW